ncbi:MAG: helix-turn-helix transcriptional regulator [Candidatus Aminicenantes bacterium]|nr:helix-turn-helix transcriptional regulator [Candidatus Aminicenantes bacterium]
MELLTRLEEAILIAVLRLGDEAYGVAVNLEVSRMFGKAYTLGALYFALDQLVRKEYLGKRLGESSAQRGGKSKTYYRLTPEGNEALSAVRAHQLRIWKTVPKTTMV